MQSKKYTIGTFSLFVQSLILKDPNKGIKKATTAVIIGSKNCGNTKEI